ncbi:MAG: hypothetical protein HDR05_06000 [Lachnospiraceae bacterium]|nr:hypothetical protein [Lachnospiraceae bacterium]
MKRKIGIIFIMGCLLGLTGCQSEELSNQIVEPIEETSSEALDKPKVEQESELPGDTLSAAVESAVEENPYFTVSREEASIDILLSDCVCEYADTDFQIYSKFIYYDKETFPYCGTVVYMQTPTDSMQIFPAQDYGVDQENGVIYFASGDENDSFVSVYKYFVEEISGDINISGAKVISTYLVEEWIADTYELALKEGSDNFSDFRLRIMSLEYEQGDVILGGKASGIYFDTGERYHIDWELNDTKDTACEENIVPHVFKVYDEEKDAEVFKACQEAFDLIEQGDRSVIVGQANMHWREGFNAAARYQRADVNGDGLPELIIGKTLNDLQRIPIDYIFAYTGGMAKTVELVYMDLNDYTEWLFLGSGGDLIYDYSDHGEMQYGGYTRYQFDENWQQQALDKLVIYDFYDTDYYDEEEDAWYKEHYPDTYGSRGGGYYFFKGSPIVNEESGVVSDWSLEEITEEEFVEIYYEMTGFDFFEENTDF